MVSVEIKQTDLKSMHFVTNFQDNHILFCYIKDLFLYMEQGENILCRKILKCIV